MSSGSSHSGPRAWTTAVLTRAEAASGRFARSGYRRGRGSADDTSAGRRRAVAGALAGRRRLDPELLAHGDRRNVVDRVPVLAGRGDRRRPRRAAPRLPRRDRELQPRLQHRHGRPHRQRVPGREVHIVGRRRWNRRGAMVTDRYQHIATTRMPTRWSPGRRDAGLPLIGIDNLPGAVPLETAVLPRGCVLLFGQEGPGLPQAHAACASVLSIAQFGSTRSINAGRRRHRDARLDPAARVRPGADPGCRASIGAVEEPHYRGFRRADDQQLGNGICPSPSRSGSSSSPGRRRPRSASSSPPRRFRSS